MTAFNEVLVAEQEAQELIAQAKKEVEDLQNETKAKQVERLAALDEEFKKEKQEAINRKKVLIEEEVSKIETEAKAEVVAVSNRFSEKRKETITFLKEQFK